MAKGKIRQFFINMTAALIEGHAKGPSWDHIYQTSLVKADKYNLGDRTVLPDGRSFTYAKSSAACISGQGCEFTATGYIAYTAFVVAKAVGASEITIPAATHAALTADELRGGYVLIFDGSGNDTQFRGIVGNASADDGAAFVVQLDASITEAITTSSAAEVYQNPFAALRTGTSVNLPKAGVPAVKVTAADTYFWVQTEGYTWIAPQAGIGATTEVGACWRHDGSLDTVDKGVEDSDFVSSQYAGHVVEGSTAGNGPLFYLRG